MTMNINAEEGRPNFHVILLFLDGIGIGKRDPDINPFARARIPVLASLCGGEFPFTPFKKISTDVADVIAVNATLHVAGLPQSGTGQTTIFTGVNGAKRFGRHFGPYPPSVLRPILEKKNIFVRLKAIGKSVVFANAFPKRFFEYIESGTRRLTATTLSCQYAEVPLLTVRELQKGEGVSADFICAQWKKLGHPEIEPITPAEAGRNLARITMQHHFTLFEYWLTDHAGHSRVMTDAVEVLERFDNFLSGIFESVNLENTLLMLISDHGNIEDLSTKSHTRHRVPCILAGKNRSIILDHIHTLADITPAIMRLFENSEE
jgi:2,3-bisphosphoglycerate-independent phosphoglycerate mutase